MECSKTTLIKRFLFFFTLMIFPLMTLLQAQTFTSLKKLNFAKICAGNGGFNQFQAAFVISGFAAGTTFEVELSDNMGSFTVPVATTTLPNSTIAGTPSDTDTDKTVTFAVPSALIGSETYRLRVKSSTGITSGAFTATASSSTIPNPKDFPAYFKSFEDSFHINNQSPNVTFCSGGSVSLTIDNKTPTDAKSSPANFPNLKYKWYKDGIAIAGQTSTTLSVNAVGNYFVEIDYGSCTDVNFRSQSVTVSVGSGGSGITINSSLGNPYCSNGSPTTLTAPSGNSFVWKKDNVVIAGATTNTYLANDAGIYAVDINFGGCSGSGSIDLKKTEIVSNLNVGSTSTIGEGETIPIIVTTNATSPTYSWYLNNVLITGATTSTFDVTSQGNYKVIISQASGCTSFNEIPFKIISSLAVTAIPNLISPNGDGINDSWIIPENYASGTNTEVQILSSYGKTIYKSNDYDNNNGWPDTPLEFKSVNPVYYYIITPQNQQIKRGSITVVK